MASLKTSRQSVLSINLALDVPPAPHGYKGHQWLLVETTKDILFCGFGYTLEKGSILLAMQPGMMPCLAMLYDSIADYPNYVWQALQEQEFKILKSW